MCSVGRPCNHSRWRRTQYPGLYACLRQEEFAGCEHSTADCRPAGVGGLWHPQLVQCCGMETARTAGGVRGAQELSERVVEPSGLGDAGSHDKQHCTRTCTSVCKPRQRYTTASGMSLSVSRAVLGVSRAVLAKMGRVRIFQAMLCLGTLWKWQTCISLGHCTVASWQAGQSGCFL